jgi:hypothetical protein
MEGIIGLKCGLRFRTRQLRPANIAEAVQDPEFLLSSRRGKGAAVQKKERARRSYFLPPRPGAQDRLPATSFSFFNISTWLTAIAGATVLLLAYHLVTSRASTGRTRRRSSWAHR